jgi:hypothetical protein
LVFEKIRARGPNREPGVALVEAGLLRENVADLNGRSVIVLFDSSNLHSRFVESSELPIP